MGKKRKYKEKQLEHNFQGLNGKLLKKFTIVNFFNNFIYRRKNDKKK